MNLFDLVAGLMLIGSAFLGFSRGAVLELVTLFAFTVAASLAVYLLPFTAPVARSTVHPVWAANAVAVGLSFLVAYIGLRLLGSNLSRRVRGHATLGSLDRTVGLGFGLVRALVVLGVVYLVFAATPFAQPPILTQARLYPVARVAGTTLASLAPGGMRQLEGFGTSLKARMGGGDPGPPPGPVEAGQEYGAPGPSAPSDTTSTTSADRRPHATHRRRRAARRHHRRPAPASVE